jgi:hypothetical protein
VGRGRIELPQPKARVLQTLGLTTCPTDPRLPPVRSRIRAGPVTARRVPVEGQPTTRRRIAEVMGRDRGRREQAVADWSRSGAAAYSPGADPSAGTFQGARQTPSRLAAKARPAA